MFFILKLIYKIKNYLYKFERKICQVLLYILDSMKRFLFFFILSIAVQLVFAQQAMQVKKNDYTSFTEPGNNYITPKKIVTKELLDATPEEYRSHPDFGFSPINAPANTYELIQKRTLESRYYVKNNSDGKDFFIQKSPGPINYADANGDIRAVDFLLHPSSVDGIYEADAQPLPTTIDFLNNYTSIKIKDIDFRFNDDLKLLFQTGSNYSASQYFNTTKHTVGRDGAYVNDIFKGMDGEIAFGKGGIKTNFIINDKNIIDTKSNYLIIEEFIDLPPGYYFDEEDEKGYYLKNGDWNGNIVLKNEFGLNILRIEKPIIIDQSKIAHKPDQADAAAYKLIKKPGGYILQIKVNTKWLIDPDRIYPVIIDPTLIGEAVYTLGDIGFEFDAMCLPWNESEYCDYTLDITVPGKTTLTAAYFDGTYYSSNFGCPGSVDCLMSQAAFRILGFCDDSPSPGGFWSCLSPVGDSAGTCWGIDLDMFNTIACVPPQCADYNFTFEMRTYHCSCTKPTCDIICHSMPIDSWIITIEGKTVEENADISTLFPDFVICEGDTIDLFASGMWGVPPYIYEWLPGGAIEDIHLVWPTTTTTYTSIIHDLCDMTDTVSQTVTVNPKPLVSAGPFEECYQTTLIAPAGFDSYIWTDSNDSILATGANTLLVDSSGFYYVTVVDGFGCEGKSTPIEAIINVAPVINAIPDTVFVNDGALALLEVETITGIDVNYLWTPSEEVTCPTCAITLSFSVGQENIYYVTGEENGCISAPDSIIVVREDSELIIPNAFTPNEDGLNDVFHILNPIFYPTFNFEIYNRWGAPIFNTDDVLSGWDGTYDDKQQEIGMYIWVITFEKANEPGKVYTLRGTVTLLR